MGPQKAKYLFLFFITGEGRVKGGLTNVKIFFLRLPLMNKPQKKQRWDSITKRVDIFILTLNLKKHCPYQYTVLQFQWEFTFPSQYHNLTRWKVRFQYIHTLCIQNNDLTLFPLPGTYAQQTMVWAILCRRRFFLLFSVSKQ